MIIFFSAKTDRFVHFAQFLFSKASRNIDRKKLLIFCDFQNDLISAVLRMDENSVFRYNLMEKEGDSMSRKKKEKFVSDFVTIDDVCSCGVTAIWSGVGSGKNGFIEGVHEEIKNNDGTTTNINVVGLAEKYRVLLITSRKAKVTETKERHAEDLSPYLTDIRHIDDVNFDEYDNKSLVCTTAHIKRRIEKDYSPSDLAPEPFWKKFDFVVIDEFHSLIADATFSDTAFIMKCFIDKIYADCIKGQKADEIKPKMIFMSGTPHTTEKLIADFEYKKYDLLNKAKYVKPKNLNFTYYKQAISDIQTTLKRGGTVVYYMCLLDKIQELITVAKEVGIDETQIAVSVSNHDTIKRIKADYPDTIYSNLKTIEDSLSSRMVIPDDIKFFITNSKNKEGININTTPDLLVIEHHYIDDIIQICGRFRNGVKKAKVIYDSHQFRLPLSYYREEEYQREQGVSAANNYFLKLAEEQNVNLSLIAPYHNKELKGFIEYIEKSTPFVRYNPFASKFEMNECYIQAKRDYDSGLYEFDELMNDYAIGKSITLSGFFYDGMHITYTASDEPIYVIKKYFSDNGWEFGVTIFNEKQGKKMLKELIKFHNAQPKTEPKNHTKLGNLLHYFKCKKVQYGRAAKKEFQVFLFDDTETNRPLYSKKKFLSHFHTA